MEPRKYERIRMQAFLERLPDNRAMAAIRVLRQDNQGRAPPVVWRTRPWLPGPFHPQAQRQLLALDEEQEADVGQPSAPVERPVASAPVGRKWRFVQVGY
jgi:hypothetical protein